MSAVRTIRTRGVSATLVRRSRRVDAGREQFATIEERAVKAIVASRQFVEDSEVRARTSGYLRTQDLSGVDEEAEDLQLKIGVRSWKVIDIEPEQTRGVRKLWLSYDE